MRGMEHASILILRCFAERSLEGRSDVDRLPREGARTHAASSAKEEWSTFSSVNSLCARSATMRPFLKT